MKGLFPTAFCLIILSSILLHACSSTSETGGQSQQEINEILRQYGHEGVDDAQPETDRTTRDISVDNPSLSLADYLRRQSGVSVSSSGGEIVVRIRGAGTISSDGSPLFVVDRMVIGHSYQDAENAIEVQDIDFIRILRGEEGSSKYGMQGAFGVIEIYSKK